MCFIVSFLLCFVHEDNAFWTLDQIFQQILPTDFMAADFVKKEKKLLIEISKTSKMFKDLKLEDYDKFIEFCIDLCLRSFFVDILSFQTVYFLWDNLFSKGSVKNLDFY